MKKHDKYAIYWNDEGNSVRDGSYGLKPCGNDLRTAKHEALAMLSKWLDRQRKDERKLKGHEQNDWDWLILSNTACVWKWSDPFGEYRPMWIPSNKDLSKIGWVEFNKRNK